jgi:hypothetical protein
MECFNLPWRNTFFCVLKTSNGPWAVQEVETLPFTDLYRSWPLLNWILIACNTITFHEMMSWRDWIEYLGNSGGKICQLDFFFFNFLNWIKFFILYIIFLPIYILDRIFWNILNSFRRPLHFISFPVFFFMYVILDNWAFQN